MQGESQGDSDQTHAQALIERLVEIGKLELVNDWGKKSLIAPIARAIDDAEDEEQAAEAVIKILEDAPEVAEVYANEEEIEAMLKGH